MALQPGTPAPDFTLKSQSDPVTLSDLRGKIVVVGFHPASFTGGWLNQVRGFRANYDKFQAANTEIVEISCDSVPVQVAWIKSMGEHVDYDGVPFPVASDFWPHGEVSRLYDVFNEQRGNSRRSIFIIDGEGVIRWSNVYTDSIPGSEELLQEIGKL